MAGLGTGVAGVEALVDELAAVGVGTIETGWLACGGDGTAAGAYKTGASC